MKSYNFLKQSYKKKEVTKFFVGFTEVEDPERELHQPMAGHQFMEDRHQCMDLAHQCMAHKHHCMMGLVHLITEVRHHLMNQEIVHQVKVPGILLILIHQQGKYYLKLQV
jgi:hypothetical protein